MSTHKHAHLLTAATTSSPRWDPTSLLSLRLGIAPLADRRSPRVTPPLQPTPRRRPTTAHMIPSTAAAAPSSASVAAVVEAAAEEARAAATTWMAKRVNVYFERAKGGYCTMEGVWVLHTEARDEESILKAVWRQLHPPPSLDLLQAQLNGSRSNRPVTCQKDLEDPTKFFFLVKRKDKVTPTPTPPSATSFTTPTPFTPTSRPSTNAATIPHPSHPSSPSSSRPPPPYMSGLVLVIPKTSEKGEISSSVEGSRNRQAQVLVRQAALRSIAMGATATLKTPNSITRFI